MYCSIWKFTGDPQVLADRYDAMTSSVPKAQMTMHACVKMDDGLWMFDTCPSEQVFRDFIAGPFIAMLAEHGLTEPAVEGYPLHAAYLNGEDVA